MEIQNELKKIAVSEEQVRKMKEVYDKGEKVSSKIETNMNTVEQIVMDPVVSSVVDTPAMPVNDTLSVNTPVSNSGSTNIFDDVVVSNPVPSVTSDVAPVTSSNVTPEVAPVSEINLFDAPSNDVVSNSNEVVDSSSNLFEDKSESLPVKEEVIPDEEDIVLSDKEIMDKLYDLELHVKQFAVELEEYLNNKKIIKENKKVAVSNIKENEQVFATNISSTEPAYGESINIFDAPNSFKL